MVVGDVRSYDISAARDDGGGSCYHPGRSQRGIQRTADSGAARLSLVAWLGGCALAAGGTHSGGKLLQLST
jgi:hypothetical protein